MNVKYMYIKIQEKKAIQEFEDTNYCLLNELENSSPTMKLYKKKRWNEHPLIIYFFKRWFNKKNTKIKMLIAVKGLSQIKNVKNYQRF